MKTEMLVVGALFTVACGPVAPSMLKDNGALSARIQDNSSEEYSSRFSLAIEEMETHEGVDFLHANTRSVIYITVDEAELPEDRIGQATVYRSATQRRCEVLIDSVYFRRISSEEVRSSSLRLVFMHEIGHCFGLKHDEENQRAIMFPYSYVSMQSSFESFSQFMDSLKEIRL